MSSDLDVLWAVTNVVCCHKPIQHTHGSVHMFVSTIGVGVFIPLQSKESLLFYTGCYAIAVSEAFQIRDRTVAP